MFNYHDVGFNLRARFLIRQGAGLIGQSPIVIIRRRSDGLYWNGAGSVWQVGGFANAMIEEGPASSPGSYYYDFNQAAAGGGSEEYHFYYANIAAPPFNVCDEETHVFKPGGGGGGSGVVGAERRLQITLGENAGQLEFAFWVEEGGRRVTDYTSLSAAVIDSDSNLVVNLGTDNTDTSDGLFSFVTAVTPITRGKPYMVRVTATRGLQVDDFLTGFVRYL